MGSVQFRSVSFDNYFHYFMNTEIGNTRNHLPASSFGGVIPSGPSTSATSLPTYDFIADLC